MLRGLWAPSPINWCEADYVVSSHVAEFYNTVSNMAYLVAGLSWYVWPPRLRERLRALTACLPTAQPPAFARTRAAAP